MLETVGVLAIATIARAAARLDVGGLPRLGTERAQDRRRVKRARPDLDVIWLKQGAALITRLLGVMRDDPRTREEFLRLVR